MKLACYITILLSLLTQTASAFCFRSFEVRHGLSDNSVLDIARDSTGYLWIATQSGLDRFDGYRFRPIPLRYSDFKSPPREIAVDGSNNIFVMTSDSLYTCFRGMLVPPTASNPIHSSILTAPATPSAVRLYCFDHRTPNRTPTASSCSRPTVISICVAAMTGVCVNSQPMPRTTPESGSSVLVVCYSTDFGPGWAS